MSPQILVRARLISTPTDRIFHHTDWIFWDVTCLLVLVLFQIVLDNKAHSGKVKIQLENRATIRECKDPNVSGQGEYLKKERLI